MIYIVFLSLFFFASFLDFGRDLTFRKLSVFYLFIFACFFIGFRFHTGNDWSGYIRYFNTVTFSNAKYGLGFKLLNISCKYLFSDYYSVQFISTLFFLFVTFHFFHKYSNYPMLGIFIFISFYFVDLYMAQLRQSIAIGILVLGIDFVIKNKPWFFLLTVIIASLFHITAVFAVLIYFTRFKYPSFVNIFFIIFSLVNIFSRSITLKIMMLGAKVISGKIGDLIIYYITNPMFLHGQKTGSGVYFFLKLIFAFFIIVCIKPKTIMDNCEKNSLTISCFITSLAFSFSILRRLEYYFGFLSVLCYLKFFDFKFVRSKKVFIIFYMIFALFFFLPFYKQRTTNVYDSRSGEMTQERWLPYYNYLNYPIKAIYRKDWNE